MTARDPPPARRLRSPSPIISFTASPLPNDSKGVKNITQHLIKSLEGLGRFDFVDAQGRMLAFDEQPESTLQNGNNIVRRVQSNTPPQRHVNGHANVGPSATPTGFPNGTARSTIAIPRKVDWEIPRKLLHSSIGFITLYLYLSGRDARNIILVLWSALAIIVPADIIRLRYPAFERLYERVLGFLMRESEKKSSNGVIWYILGANFVLSFYPRDVATVAILILSWADTSASTFGRMFGHRTAPLPRRLPFLRLPLSPRKSVAGFIAASITGACVAIGFWGWIAPLRQDGMGLSWTWQGGVSSPSQFTCLALGCVKVAARGWIGLGAIGVVAGLVSGVAEALDIGSLDDNLTLPIISGGCILAFLKLVAAFS
ncbi:hypothetical protein APHAL10511_007178 [Amanita phalloides]|nr:hypothetical protein APHAL10511_007178 [Amanita phalloides]